MVVSPDFILRRPSLNTRTFIERIPTRILLLASVVCMLSGAEAPAQQVMGPPQPRPVVRQESPVVNAIGRFLKGHRTEKRDAGEDTNNQSGKEAGASERPVVRLPLESENAGHPAHRQEEPKRPPLLSQPPLTNVRVEAPEVDMKNPPVTNHPKLNDPANPLGFTEAENRLHKYAQMIEARRYEEAKPGILQLRQWLVDLTEAHIGLYKTLNQVPSARGQAELEKELALQFAQLRDRALVDAARIYISEKDYFRAIKELTDVVKSQPRSKLGLRAYELLQEIGFTEKLQLTQQ